MIKKFNEFINETHWGGMVRRSSGKEMRKEDGYHMYTNKWEKSVKIKCDDDVFDSVLREVLFWRRNYDLTEGPEGHWFISESGDSSIYTNGMSQNIDLLHSENNSNCIVFDSFSSFNEVEEGWYGEDCVPYDIDEEDYNKVIDVILDKVDGMQFIHSDWFDNEGNVDSADGYGIVLCEINNNPDMETRRNILKRFQKFISSKSKFNEWEMKHYTCVWNDKGTDVYLIMLPCEYLFDNFDEVCGLARKAAEEYGC